MIPSDPSEANADAAFPLSAEAWLPVVYNELRRMAAAKMAEEKPGNTLQPTALVHEAWLKLVDESHPWESRSQFMRAAAEAMRRILVDRARMKLAAKRGGPQVRHSIENMNLATEVEDDLVLSMHEALQALATEQPDMAELVKLRFFVGMPIVDAAEHLNISPATAKRNWNFARAWLLKRLHANQDASA